MRIFVENWHTKSQVHKKKCPLLRNKRVCSWPSHKATNWGSFTPYRCDRIILNDWHYTITREEICWINFYFLITDLGARAWGKRLPFNYWMYSVNTLLYRMYLVCVSTVLHFRKYNIILDKCNAIWGSYSQDWTLEIVSRSWKLLTLWNNVLWL